MPASRRPMEDTDRPSVAIVLMCHATASGIAGNGQRPRASHHALNAAKSFLYAALVLAAFSFSANSRSASCSALQVASAPASASGIRSCMEAVLAGIGGREFGFLHL
jgi:hypothetical protein